MVCRYDTIFVFNLKETPYIIRVGSFGLPNGIVFSQPVALNDLKMWQPFKNFPLRKKADEQIKKLISPVKELLESFGVATTYTEYT